MHKHCILGWNKSPDPKHKIFNYWYNLLVFPKQLGVDEEVAIHGASPLLPDLLAEASCCYCSPLPFPSQAPFPPRTGGAHSQAPSSVQGVERQAWYEAQPWASDCAPASAWGRVECCWRSFLAPCCQQEEDWRLMCLGGS